MPRNPNASATVAEPLSAAAPAKVNLTLQVTERRADGWHGLESLVAFADVADLVTLIPDLPLDLIVGGPTAVASGPAADNLILKAAQALMARVSGLRVGRFYLDKQLPVAAGIGGGSSDAAATLRLLAQLNGLVLDDERLMAAARSVGADVPVCLDPQARMMRGVGGELSPPVRLPVLPAVLVNPGVMVATPDVFRALGLKPGEFLGRAAHPDASMQAMGDDWLKVIVASRNDLTAPALRIAPVIGEVLNSIEQQADCQLARMSGSGATCFGLFPSDAAAQAAARALSRTGWWVRATHLA